MASRPPSGEFISLPFFSKVTAQRTVNLANVKSYNKSNNALAADSPNSFVEYHNRSGLTVNRRRPLSGSSTPWIPPSTYSRRVDRWLFSAGGKYADPGSTLYNVGQLPRVPITNSYAGSLPLQANPYYSQLSAAVLSNFDTINMGNHARTEALNDLADSKAGLGENLAQAIKTADLFLDAGLNLYKFYTALRRGRIWKLYRNLTVKQVKDAVKDGSMPKVIADQWLAYHYGWKPLAYDAYGLFELLKERLSPALLVHGRGQSRLSWENNWTRPSGITRYPPFRFNETTKLSYRCQLTGRIESNEYLRTLNRVGLLNPVSFAWDLIPFSFVLDWIIPIGDVAYGLSASAGLSFVGGHTVMRNHRICDVTLDAKYAYGGGPTPAANYAATGFERTALGGFPRPVPYVKSPFTGASRLATLFALITKIAT